MQKLKFQFKKQNPDAKNWQKLKFQFKKKTQMLITG